MHDVTIYVTLLEVLIVSSDKIVNKKYLKNGIGRGLLEIRDLQSLKSNSFALNHYDNKEPQHNMPRRVKEK